MVQEVVGSRPIFHPEIKILTAMWGFFRLYGLPFRRKAIKKPRMSRLFLKFFGLKPKDYWFSAGLFSLLASSHAVRNISLALFAISGYSILSGVSVGLW